MKHITVLFGLVTVTLAVNQVTFPLPQEKVPRIQKIASECAQETNVDPGLYPRLADGTLPRDEASNKYLYCFAIKTGLIHEDGHMIIDKMAGLLGDGHPLKEQFKEAMKKCNEITKENPVETVMEMNRCYSETSPVRIVF